MATIKIKKSILILTPFFSPNIGGVETHLNDLVQRLDQLNYRVYVQTFSPITTQKVSWKKREIIGKNIHIRRYYWFGKQIFHKIEKYPFFDFLYLTPYLFFRTFFWMLDNSKKINTIHAQGLNASFAGFLLKLIFKKRLITSIHAIYETNPKSITAKLNAWVLNQSDQVLTLSLASQKELLDFGVIPQKLHVYRYWIQLNHFYPLNKVEIRHKLKIKNNFTVLFVGRLIKKKGIRLLVKVAQKLPQINFIFIGAGPESDFLSKQKKYSNILYLSQIPNHLLIKYYNLADVFCIPSLYEEGFGRVVMEAVACGIPVIGSNKGGIKEALDSSVSILFKPTYRNLKSTIEKLHKNPKLLQKLQKQTINYAKSHFSDQNIKLITRYY